MDALVAYAAAVAPAPEYKGRWGYHPCDYATYRDIKELHRWALYDFRATRRRDRWRAKLPHNRPPGPEPKAYGTDRRLYFWILDEYRKARHPKPSAALVVPLRLPTAWRELLTLTRDYHLENGAKGVA